MLRVLGFQVLNAIDHLMQMQFQSDRFSYRNEGISTTVPNLSPILFNASPPFIAYPIVVLFSYFVSSNIVLMRMCLS